MRASLHKLVEGSSLIAVSPKSSRWHTSYTCNNVVMLMILCVEYCFDMTTHGQPYHLLTPNVCHNLSCGYFDFETTLSWWWRWCTRLTSAAGSDGEYFLWFGSRITMTVVDFVGSCTLLRPSGVVIPGWSDDDEEAGCVQSVVRWSWPRPGRVTRHWGPGGSRWDAWDCFSLLVQSDENFVSSHFQLNVIYCLWQ